MQLLGSHSVRTVWHRESTEALKMENLTTLASLLNITDNVFNTTQITAAGPPRGFTIPRYPPGYFVIPADLLNKIRLAMYAVIIPITAIIGLVGNIVSFKVLLRHKMPKTTRMVLLAITVFDFLNLITALIYCYMMGISRALSFKPGLNAGTRAHAIFGSYFMMVFGRISSMLIVIISLERLCAVYFPLKIKTICSTKVMAGCIIVSGLFCALFFVPLALEYKAHDIKTPNSSEVTAILLLTELGKNRNIYATFHSSNMIMTRIIPVFIVMICNAAISINLYRSRSTRSEMTSQKSEESSAEHRITKMLFSLSVLYFICIMPNSLLIIVQLFDVDRPYPFNRNNVYNLLTILFYWTEVINSSANFIIYIFSSQQMREEFKGAAVCGSSETRNSRSDAYDVGSTSKGTSVSTVSGMGE